jgi:hypothetical protein
MVLPSCPARLDFWNCGSGRGEEPGGAASLRLIQIRVATPSLAKITRCCQAQSLQSAKRRSESQKRSQLFIGVHNETLSVAAVCVCNKDCFRVGING